MLDMNIQVTEQVSKAGSEGKEHAAMRYKLEADLMGCKAWIRTLEETEQKYLQTIRCVSNVGTVMKGPGLCTYQLLATCMARLCRCICSIPCIGFHPGNLIGVRDMLGGC